MTTEAGPSTGVHLNPTVSAGPSSVPISTSKSKGKRKPSTPHPSTSVHNQRTKRRKIAPPLPIPIIIGTLTNGVTKDDQPNGGKTLPIKTLQGVGTKRTDVTKGRGRGPARGGVGGREVVYVTRKTGLGMYLGRCKSLIVDEGYTHIIIHALGAAIPQALVLLHALLDALPYPKSPRGVWYELFTGTSGCVDELDGGDLGLGRGKGKGTGAAAVHGKGKAKKQEKTQVPTPLTPEDGMGDALDEVEEQSEGEKVAGWLDGIGGVEAEENVRVERLVSSLQIHIHIGPKAETVLRPLHPLSSSKQHTKQGEEASAEVQNQNGVKNKRARPSKGRRKALAARRAAEAGGIANVDEGDAEVQDVDMDEEEEDEEAAMNAFASAPAPRGAVVDDSSDEEVEQVEMR